MCQIQHLCVSVQVLCCPTSLDTLTRKGTLRDLCVSVQASFERRDPLHHFPLQEHGDAIEEVSLSSEKREATANSNKVDCSWSRGCNRSESGFPACGIEFILGLLGR